MSKISANKMKYIKFKIAVHSHGKDIFPEIPGYLVIIHDIPFVIHNWHHSILKCIYKQSKQWTISEYHSGQLIRRMGWKDCKTREQIIEQSNIYINHTIKRIGIKEFIETIKLLPQINSEFQEGKYSVKKSRSNN